MLRRSIAVTLSLLLGGALAGAVHAQAQEKGAIVVRFRTSTGALACLSRTKIDAAMTAAKTHDRAALDQLGCFPVKAGLAATRGSDGKQGDPLWEVVLDPRGPEPITAWAYYTSFVADNGDKLDKDGRRETSR